MDKEREGALHLPGIEDLSYIKYWFWVSMEVKSGFGWFTEHIYFRIQ